MHNADKVVGKILLALEEEEVADSTVIIYLADQGASLPTSKQNLYPYSTRVPLLVKWPGITKRTGETSNRMVSVIDIMATILDGINLPVSSPIEGVSFLSELSNVGTRGRDHIITAYNYARRGVQVFPMRAIQSEDFLYIYNGWAGENHPASSKPITYHGEPLMGQSWKAMKEAAKRNNEINLRVNFIENRAREEFYDLSTDEYCLNNLIDSEQHIVTIASFKAHLEQHMKAVNDPILDHYQGAGSLPESWFTPT